MGDRVRHGAEDPAGALHSLAADHDQVGADLLGDLQDAWDPVVSPSPHVAAALAAIWLAASLCRPSAAPDSAMAAPEAAPIPPPDDLYAVTTCNSALSCRARSAAVSTALSAVAEPSVPTTTRVYVMPSPLLSRSG